MPRGNNTGTVGCETVRVSLVGETQVTLYDRLMYLV